MLLHVGTTVGLPNLPSSVNCNKMAANRLLSRRHMLQQQQLCFPYPACTRHSIILSGVKVVGASGLNSSNHSQSGDDKGFLGGSGKHKSTVAAKVVVTSTEILPGRIGRICHGLDPVILLEDVGSNRVIWILPKTTKWKADPLQAQTFIERVIVNCRFFTLLAIAGSLLGSVLCFVEGCIMVLRSYLHYLNTISIKLDPGKLVPLIIKAIDMYLVATAMLILGMGIYVMFVSPQNTTTRTSPRQLPMSGLFSRFHLGMMPSWLEMKSVSQAKSRLGHAVVMLLQAGVLEKFNTVPIATGVDLACFAGAVFLSSGSIFFLSKLRML